MSKTSKKDKQKHSRERVFEKDQSDFILEQEKTKEAEKKKKKRAEHKRIYGVESFESSSEEEEEKVPLNQIKEEKEIDSEEEEKGEEKANTDHKPNHVDSEPKSNVPKAPIEEPEINFGESESSKQVHETGKLKEDLSAFKLSPEEAERLRIIRQNRERAAREKEQQKKELAEKIEREKKEMEEKKAKAQKYKPKKK